MHHLARLTLDLWDTREQASGRPAASHVAESALQHPGYMVTAKIGTCGDAGMRYGRTGKVRQHDDTRGG